jgi:hypothetical protein
MQSGDATFAATIWPGCFSDTTASAYAPSTCAERLAHGRDQRRRARQQRLVDQVRRDLGVGLGGELAAGGLRGARAAPGDFR